VRAGLNEAQTPPCGFPLAALLTSIFKAVSPWLSFFSGSESRCKTSGKEKMPKHKKRWKENMNKPCMRQPSRQMCLTWAAGFPLFGFEKGTEKTTLARKLKGGPGPHTNDTWPEFNINVAREHVAAITGSDFIDISFNPLIKDMSGELTS